VKLADVGISIKLPLIVAALTVATALLASAAAYLVSADALREAAEVNLVAARDARKHALIRYLESVTNHLASLARRPTIADPSADIRTAWRALDARERAELAELYDARDVAAPTEALDRSDGMIRYYAAHARHHQSFSEIAQSHGYYDLFLVDANGDLFYTVEKESDFATNLLDGEWRESGLADAFRAVKEHPKPGFIAFSDYARYAPSGNKPAAFLAAPTFDDTGDFAGAVLIQLPVDRVDATLQLTAGLGESGETYIVGLDGLMRSRSRLLYGSTILEIEIETEAVRRASAGESGVMLVDGYRDEPVLSAFGPVEFLGVTWALLAEIREEEVLAPVARLRRILRVSSALIAIVSAGLGFVFARTLARPIRTITGAMGRLARHDISVEVPWRGRGDEIGAMADALQVFKDNAAKRIDAEARLRASEAQMRAVVDNMPGIIYRISRVDGGWHPVLISEKIQEITGYPASYFADARATRRYLEIVHPDDVGHLAARRSAAAESGEAFSCWYRITTASGETRWLDERGKGTLVDGAPAFVDGNILDVTERKLAERDLAEKEATLRGTLENMPGSVFVVDEDLRLRVWNAHFPEFYAMPEGLIYEGAPLQGVLRMRAERGEYGPGDPDELVAMRVANYADRSVVHVEDHVPGGRVLDVVRAPTGDGGLVVLSHDVTDRTRMEAELRRAREVAEAASEAKARFLANMSHEIRTPMNAIIGLSHLALSTDLSDRQRDYLNKVHASAHNLLGIINDILDFSKIEAGKLELEAIEFDLHEVLDNLAAVSGIKASDKGLELLFEIEPEVPMQLVGDPLRLGQVLLNLANNAVKFTENGQIVLRVRTLARDGDTVRLRFDVTDSGIGMSEEQTAQLFQSFSQVDASITRKYGGTGLGLAISKQLVEMMGGEIAVDSAPGEGSVFHFTVHLGAPEEAGPTRRFTAAALEGLRVLVVDDNAMSREILREYCVRYGFAVETVDSGEAAVETFVEHVRDDPFRLVLMDWKMPGIDGLEASRRIRERAPPECRPEIVMVTAYGREDVVRRAEDLDGFLVKPVTPSSLLDSVMVAFGEQPDGAARWVSGTPELPGHVRGAHLLLAEDNEVNRQVATELLEQAGTRVSVAHDGAQALAALEDETFDGVLMDMQMPVMDGLMATRRIRENPRFRDLPVIAMTANAMASDRQQCLDAGMNDHVAKPIVVRELFETLGRWVRASDPGQMPALVPGQDAQDLPVPALAGIDVEDGVARVGGSAPAYRRILTRFRAGQAEAAEAIRSALEGDDREQAERLAHTVKGVAGNIGAHELRAAAAALESAIRSNAGDVETLVAAVDGALDIVLRSIDSLTAEAAGVSSEAAAVDLGRARELIEQLHALVEESDAEATDAAQELAAALRGSPHGSVAKALAADLDAYDFESARTSLECLAAELS
jgi:PAS domain S-box-containing protein